MINELNALGKSEKDEQPKKDDEEEAVELDVGKTSMRD